MQSIFGTLRLYNRSEQSYESLSPKTTFTDIPALPVSTKKTQTDNNENAFFYVTQNKEEIEKALKEMPSEKAQDAAKKIQTIQTNGVKKSEKETTKTETVKKKYISPVEIRVEPEE